MKVSKTDNRFKTGFPKPITGLPKKPILTSLIFIQSKKFNIQLIMYVRFNMLHFLGKVETDLLTLY